MNINVVTRLQDNGDGGYTLYVYNSNEEMLADHPLAWKATLTEEQKDDISNEDDPYENGYIGKSSIEIEIVDGKPRLAKTIIFHAGQ